MKKIFLVLVVIAATASLLTSCGGSSPRDFADRFVAAENRAWSTGDLAELEALEATDVVYHLPGLELAGWKAHADYIINARPTISGLKQNWKYLSGEGNHVVLSYDSSAVLNATEKTPSTTASNSYLFVLRLQNGKIAEVWANGSMTSTPLTEAQTPAPAGK